MKNKRGIFTPIFAFFAIVLLTYTFFVFNTENGKVSAEVGAPQTGLISLYGEAEGDLFYAEECIGQKGQKGIADFFSNGGVNAECGGEWKTGSKECYPNFEGNLKLYVTEAVKICGNVKDVRIEDGNYIVDMENLKYDRKEGLAEINYEVPVVVKNTLGFKMDKLTDLRKKIFQCLKEKSFESCVNKIKGLKRDMEGNLQSFSYGVLDEELLLYSNGNLLRDKPNFKFKLNSKTQGVWLEA